MKYIMPSVFATSFTCPNCHVVAMQNWWYKDLNGNQVAAPKEHHSIRVANCQHCRNVSIWYSNMMYYPLKSNAPSPNQELPESALKLYSEAALICEISPRGAAALLRLAIQKLCKELGESGENINADIGSLVKKGLPVIVQQSLDIVRVTGNDAVHPGQIDTDNLDTVNQLFSLINIIVEYMIALPKQVSGIYSGLPTEKVDGINLRDKK